jgi:flagellar basal body-associated protein FliL
MQANMVAIGARGFSLMSVFKQPGSRREGTMANSNEFTYAKQFDGNLHADSQLVPVKVTTRLRVMNDNTAQEIRKYSSHAFDKPPQYVFGGGNLPLNPSLQAMGRHYFTW